MVRKNIRVLFRTLPTYSSTDIWKPPIHVSDWLICCCGNLILYQKNKNDKNTNFMMKNSKKMSEKYMKALRNIFYERAAPSCNMLQILERRRKYIGAILLDEHTPKHLTIIFF